MKSHTVTQPSIFSIPLLGLMVNNADFSVKGEARNPSKFSQNAGFNVRENKIFLSELEVTSDSYFPGTG